MYKFVNSFEEFGSTRANLCSTWLEMVVSSIWVNFSCNIVKYPLCL